MSTYLWTYTPPQWTRLTHCTWCLIIWISILFIQDLVCGGEPVSKILVKTRTQSPVLCRDQINMSGKNLGQILIQLRSNQYCATISFENENYLHEGKTKRREDSSVFEVLMIETVSENEKTKVWNKKIFLLERWTNVLVKDEIELDSDFHIRIGNICLRYIDVYYTDLLY